ncbi:MAG: helix-turn-helix domain-containing protein [Halanaerobiales bacterium]
METANKTHEKMKDSTFEHNLSGQTTVNLLKGKSIKTSTGKPQDMYYRENLTITLIKYLKNNYKNDVTLDDLADVVNYSPFYLIRLFKKETGKTPFKYLQQIRILKAKDMLKNSDQSITDICFEVGFNNRCYFSSTFKEKVGLAPSEYRKKAL